MLEGALAAAPPSSAAQVERYPSGAIRGWVPTEPFTCRWRGVPLSAQHEEDPPRRASVASLQFYESGGLKSLSLAQATTIEASVGSLSAERLTFHEDGSLRRLFPTAGKPCATWSDADERELSPSLSLGTPVGNLQTRVISANFHPSGALRSITLWPGDTLELATPLGRRRVRVGVAFHESGALRSFEPAEPTELETPVGTIVAYHAQPVGIHGDKNSVEFAQDGSLVSVLTESDELVVTDLEGRGVARHGASDIPSRCEEAATECVPMLIQFLERAVVVGGQRYAIAEHRFEVRRPERDPRRLPMCSG